MIRRLICSFIGHRPLRPTALWGSCRRCGHFYRNKGATNGQT